MVIVICCWLPVDITQMKEYERELIKAKEKLEDAAKTPEHGARKY